MRDICALVGVSDNFNTEHAYFECGLLKVSWLEEMDFAFGGRRATLVGTKQLYDVDPFSENQRRRLFYDYQPATE